MFVGIFALGLGKILHAIILHTIILLKGVETSLV